MGAAALAVLLRLNVWCDRNVNWHEASVSVIETSTEAGCTPRGKSLIVFKKL